MTRFRGQKDTSKEEQRQKRLNQALGSKSKWLIVYCLYLGVLFTLFSMHGIALIQVFPLAVIGDLVEFAGYELGVAVAEKVTMR